MLQFIQLDHALETTRRVQLPNAYQQTATLPTMPIYLLLATASLVCSIKNSPSRVFLETARHLNPPPRKKYNINKTRHENTTTLLCKFIAYKALENILI